MKRITAEDKDIIIGLLIDRADDDMFVELGYNHVEHIGISKGQHEIIMEEFQNRGFVKRNGYSDYYDLKAPIFQWVEYGGYSLERDAYFETIKNITLQVEKLESILSPTVIDKINNIIEKTKNLAELTTAIDTIRHIAFH